MPCSEFCGLLTKEKLPIPLQGISVDVQVKGFVADVLATLKYKNTEENAVEAIFFFPMDEGSAVYSFAATIEGKTIIADLREKEQAKEIYDEAINQGQQAFLLQEDRSGDIFSCSVGNLPPGQEAEVTLKYVIELSVEADGAVRYVLPAVLNPRYTPKGEAESCTATLPHVPISELPYTLSLVAQFQSAYGINKIESSCAITPIEYTNSDKTEAKVALTDGHKFDRDVEIRVYYNDVNKPSVTLESGLPDAGEGSFMSYPVAMLNFYPNIPESQEQSKCGEFIFVVDRSGSMEVLMNSEPFSPMRIQSAKETLVLLLKSLPLGCYFNIYGFGSTFDSFFPESMAYTQETLDAAVEKVNQMLPDMGGTEILEPLKKIFKTAGRAQHPRQVFIFTDGEVGNTQEVIAEVLRNSHNHRCFSFGIGEGASTALIKGMARAGNGTYEFITGKDRLQPKVLKALKCALQPAVNEVSLIWTLPPDVEQNTVCQIPNAIFQGQRSIIYVQLKGKLEEEKEAQVSLQYNFREETFTNELKFPLKIGNVGRLTIHRLAAKNRISFLESGEESEEVKKMILETSLESGVVSSLTSYVAVNKDTKTHVEGPPIQRFLPPVAMACSFYPPPPISCLGPQNILYCGAQMIPDMPPDLADLPAVVSCCPPMLPTPDGSNPDNESNVPDLTVGEGEIPEVSRCPPMLPPADVAICGLPGDPIIPVVSCCPPMLPTPTPADVAICGLPGDPIIPVVSRCPPMLPTPTPADEIRKPEPDALYNLIALQKADGSWDGTSGFATIMGIPEHFTRLCPLMAQEEDAKFLNVETVELPVWATVLAVIWLHTNFLDQREEWELLERKAVSWIKSKPGVDLPEALRAGNEFLKASVDIAIFTR